MTMLASPERRSKTAVFGPIGKTPEIHSTALTSNMLSWPDE
jgi:hypothetical protein